jgi:hypothetical protein
MSKQIFKYEVPFELLTQLLDKICEPIQTYYIDINAYKIMRFHNYHLDFLSSLIPYYHWSKQFYLERKCTYYSFMTIIRQICRLHNIEIKTTTHCGNTIIEICKDYMLVSI